MAQPPDAAAAAPVVGGSARVLVGPANFAGQGRALADALATLPRVTATSYAVGDATARLADPAHHLVAESTLSDPDGIRAHEDWLTSFTHVVVESGRPLVGRTRGLDALGDLAWLESRGVVTAVLAHGTDVRRPDWHVAREPDSPYRRLDPAARAVRQRFADRWAPVHEAARWSFVTTPDLLDDVPGARWVPVVVDPRRWEPPRPWEPAPGPPLVVHAPSHPVLKGTDLVEPHLLDLQDRGVLRYCRLSGLAHDEVPAALAEADVVLDQFALGSYGVAAVEAMAAGRVVVGHVRPEVRARVLDLTGWELPIVQARAGELPGVLAELLGDRDRLVDTAARGPAFVSAVHDGRLSAEVLRTCAMLGAALRRDDLVPAEAPADHPPTPQGGAA